MPIGAKLLPINNEEVLIYHEQKKEHSCVPMSVEFMLKLAGELPLKFNDFQDGLDTVKSEKGHGSEYQDKEVGNVILKHLFDQPRGSYDVTQLIETIKKELDAGRYVQIALDNGVGGYHCWVVWGYVDDTMYAITKYQNQRYPVIIDDVITRLKNMGGSDIIVYRELSHEIKL